VLLTCDQPPLVQSKTTMDWDRLPAGVRFDPSDEELLEHLAAKVGRSGTRPHPMLDEFIVPLVEEDGICRTHPENLPGVKKDGSSCHYFHKPSMAYTTGTRKRRKIQTDDVVDGGADVRWHKTGKTRPVQQGGRVLGFKKIMVLYRATGKKSKNVKTNWVMHQYHLGSHEEERDGELVVCKVFFQKAPRSCPSRKTVPQDDEDCDPSESDIGFQEPSAAGLSGDSPSVSAVTRGMPPVTPKSFAPSRTAKQLYAEPTESNSEIFDPQALATQSKQRAPVEQQRALQFQAKKVNGFDVNQSPSGSILPQPLTTLNEMEPTTFESDQSLQNTGVGTENLACEGEDESFHAGNHNEAVSLSEVHPGWEIDPPAQPALSEDPTVSQLLCNEHLNGDPLVQDAAYEDFNWRSCAYEVGCSLEEEPYRCDSGRGEQAEVDPALNDLVLDTPPDMLEDPVVTSQEVRDWLGTRKDSLDLDNTDSQSTT